MEDEEASGDEDVARNHVAKRARYNKSCVVVFDNADRTEYLSGFRKRKQKRRQVALEHKMHKERQKRLQDRRERRTTLRESLGQPEGAEDEGQSVGDVEDEGENAHEPVTKDVSGTSIFEDQETMTVVRVTTLGSGDEDETEDRLPSHEAPFHSQNAVRPGPTKLNVLKKGKVKFKKPKKVQSEKRMRKLTRREKSVPRNLRSRRDKKRNK